jgi:hypothetical protein
MIQTLPSHVALLVPSARKAADYLSQFGFQIGPEDRFADIGTLEIYVEGSKTNSLLLMEATGPGPYQRAFDKRGPGLHHLAIDVINLQSFIDSIAVSGWLLHPKSLKTLSHQTIYLARPGFPGLIEVKQKDRLGTADLFVKEINLNLDSNATALLKAIGLTSVIKPGKDLLLALGEHKIEFKKLL